MPTTPIRIVVVDDNLHYRNTISSFLQKKNNFQVVAEAGDGLAAIQAVEKHRPDVVLMDISMPVMDGIDATSVIKSKFPEVRVIILTMHDVDCIAEAAFKSGAFWCLNKGCSLNEIIKAIRTAVI
jgi:DNA-binding NarL/FixJ family response regulator